MSHMTPYAGDPARCRSILIVEDEEIIRDSLKTILEFEGYPVFTAANGEEGLRALRTLPRPCLVLLDMLMPVMNGAEFIAAKSHEDAIASIPVCIVSGIADRPNLAGTVGYVKKPFDLESLLNFVRKFCDGAQETISAKG